MITAFMLEVSFLHNPEPVDDTTTQIQICKKSGVIAPHAQSYCTCIGGQQGGQLLSGARSESVSCDALETVTAGHGLLNNSRF